jgi:hypothetical protein
MIFILILSTDAKVNNPLEIVRNYLDEVQKAKMFKIFKKCEGDAHFESPKVIVSAGKRYTAKR